MAGGGALIGLGSLFALGSALSWGVGDFVGGLLSRYSSVILAMIAVQSIPVIPVVALLVLSGEAAPPAETLTYALIAGSAGIIGLAFFYFALSRGTMGVIAPLSALIGAGLPVLVGFAGGEEMSGLRLLGVVAGLVAVVLISIPARPETTAERSAFRIDVSELPFVLIAGVGFAGFFVFMDRATSDGATWWPLAVVRFVGLAWILAGLLVLFVHQRVRDPDGALARVLRYDGLRAAGVRGPVLFLMFAVAGTTDLGGTLLYTLASQTGALSVAVVISSLYPVVTVILAALLLHERLRPWQILGVALATISVPLLR